MDAQQFLRDYVLLGKPVMIKGLLSGSSPSLGAYFNAVRWSPLRLREAYGDVRVQVGDIPYASAFGQPSSTMYISEYYEDPQVTVNIVEIKNQKILVVGEVATPTVLQLSNQMSILEALTLTGGINPSAKTSNVLLIRGGVDAASLYTVDVHSI